MIRPDAAIITPGTFAIPSGKSSSVEIVIEQLAGQLNEIGHLQVAVLGRQGRLPAAESRGGVNYIRVPAPSPTAYIRAVSRKLLRLKPKLIQVDNRPRYVRYLRRRHPQAAIWLMLHSVTFVSGKHIRPAELKRCLEAADRIVVNSHFMKEQLSRKAPGCSHKIAVNHLGVDPAHYYPRWTPQGEAVFHSVRQKLGLLNKKIVLYAGRLIPEKGVHHLLAAMPTIAMRVPEAVLVVVGSARVGSRRITPYVRELYRMGSRMPQHVRFIPYVPHHRMADLYAIADCLAVPSGPREAFGLVNVEAMASGLPVVAADAGGIKEIVRDGETGYLLSQERLEQELAVRIEQVLSDGELALRMGEAGRRLAGELFTWESMARRWLNDYHLTVR